MAISMNLGAFTMGTRFAGLDGGPASGAAIGGGAPAAPPATAAPAAPAPAAAASTMFINPALLGALAANANVAATGFVRPGLGIPPILPPIVLQPQARPRTTQLARAAIDQLNAAPQDTVRRAVNAVRSQAEIQSGADIMLYLERSVRVGEVLGNQAKDWSDTTKADFARALGVEEGRLDVMDGIVSTAILNDRDLEGEILDENMPQAGPNDWTQNRKVIWQFPSPGTVLTPPYVILVAVESQDVSTAQDVLKSINDQLGTVQLRGDQTFKLPKAAIQKL